MLYNFWTEEIGNNCLIFDQNILMVISIFQNSKWVALKYFGRKEDLANPNNWRDINLLNSVFKFCD